MMRRFRKRTGVVAVVFVMPTVLFATSEWASAHVLRQDNGISAELHIPPADQPRAGQLTTLELSFGDSRDVFSLQNCNCRLVIAQDGQTVRSLDLQPATAGATLSSSPVVQFPRAGKYDVVVQGSAKDSNFSNFRLDYRVDVSPGVSDMAASADKRRESAWTYVAIGVTAVLLCLGIAIQVFRFRRGSR